MNEYIEGQWNNTTPTTALAIEIRRRLGKHNDPTKPVVDLIEIVVAAHDDLLAVCRELAEIFPEYSMGELGAADFKDRASRIWTASQSAKNTIAKAERVETQDDKSGDER